MGLEFSPLYFIYHDGWRWKETKTLVSYDSNGNPIYVDKSKNFYHRGHCHLFLPEFNTKTKSSTLAYSGEQVYKFEIKDEWGPNSNDPNQFQSTRLLGKPLWYFYVEEYWRRMYIQPYDMIDHTCKLPLNQSISYDKIPFENYLSEQVDKIDKTIREIPNIDDIDIKWVSQDYYDFVGGAGYGFKFKNYYTILIRASARKIWYEEIYGKNNLSDREIIDFIQTNKLEDEFEEFYKNNAIKYNGYVTQVDAMKKFLNKYHVDYNQYEQDADGYVYIPQEQTVGHIGIKYDASKPQHSLGPFREGGQLYFFNTVVNRTMPVEYWLDEDKKTRQYYLKQKQKGIDTTGGGTWTFKNDNTHFIWYYDQFAETQQCIYEWDLGENEYNNADTYISGYYSYNNHKTRNVDGIDYAWNRGYLHVYNFLNSKCVKTDKHFYNGVKWIGTNEKVIHDEALFNNENNISFDVQHDGESNNAIIQEGYYDDEGWHPYSSSSSSSIQNNTEKELKIKWDGTSGWYGWYEYGEIIKCAYDKKWYKRTWKPVRYKLSNPYEQQTPQNAPHWHYKKRQAFPNPPPWLCDNPYENDSSSSSMNSSSSSSKSHFARRNDVYDNDEDNRIHLLHWQYCHYYNLVRYKGYNGEISISEYLYEYREKDNLLNAKTYYSLTDYGAEYGYGKITLELVSKKALTWERIIDDYFIENNITSMTIEEQNFLFQNFISNLPIQSITEKNENVQWIDYIIGQPNENIYCRYSPLYYRDYTKYFKQNEDGSFVEIPKSTIDFNENTYEEKEIKKKLPSPTNWVNASSPSVSYSVLIHDEKYTTSQQSINIDNYKQCLSYITFQEFKMVWTPLSQKELEKLKLDGDYPKRNKTPYPHPNYEQAYGSSSSENLISGELEHRNELIKKLQEESLNESAPSLLNSAFFPRVDDETRRINEIRGSGNYPLPPFKLSILEQVDKIPEYDFIDPYRNGTVNPIENWKKYFNKRQVYTIPDGTIIKGDKPITNPEGTPNSPFVHPRETSYSIEDGARRFYPDDKYISPIIEYQKIIRLNWQRLPQKKKEEEFIQANWKTDQRCKWGDGFSSQISIPFKINREIQSPFSDSSKITKPIGEYCHNCVKQENKMRYHIEWYDSLEKIRKYDFPNYINLINDFQLKYIIPGKEKHYLNSYYQENFNDYQKTLELRKNYSTVDKTKTWEELLNEYWKKIDKEYNFSNTPIVRNHDCYGNEIEQNTFVSLKNGKKIWRTETTYYLPTIDKVSKTKDDEGNDIYGYRDSEGNIRKGGNVVEWNDPYNQNDGIWVEQCLGAVIKTRCVQILEDRLGYRWKQITEDTAMQSNDLLMGSDYDL